MLNLAMMNFEFEVFDAVLLEEIGKFYGAIDDICEFID